MLKEKEGILIENSDIQYQEGIAEALDKYPLTDMVILKDDIIGELTLEDLILSITLIKNDIEIILITEQNLLFEKSKNIIKVVDDKTNYINHVEKYLIEKVYINNKKEINSKEKTIDTKACNENYDKLKKDGQIWRETNNQKKGGKVQRLIKKRKAEDKKAKEEIKVELSKDIKEKLKDEEFVIELKLKEKTEEKLRIKVNCEKIEVSII